MNKIFRKDLAGDYGVDVRTIDRWKHEKLLPRPRLTPAGRPYWTPEQIKRTEDSKIRRYTESEKRRVRMTAHLLKKKRMAAAKKAARQFNLPLQLQLPVKL